MQAVALADAVTAHPADPVGPGAGLRGRLPASAPSRGITCRSKPIEPARLATAATASPRPTGSSGIMNQLMQLGSNDPIVGRAILRAVNLLATPQQLMGEAEVVTRIMELAAARAAVADGDAAVRR